ncbi:pilus assembly protein PilM [Patescibacteria group bacterium]|nr:pilus assembly protein PilM [Patescibacteria group bacterium]
MGGNFLFRFFPVPRYLKMPAVGIDISDRSIKYVEMEKVGGFLRLKKFGDKKVEKRAVEKGEVKQKEILIETLRLIEKETNNKFVIASLPEEKAFLKIVRLPLMSRSQIRKSLELQLEEIVPFSPADIVYDFEIVKNPSKKDSLEIALSAFPREIIEDYVEIFEKAGFIPVVFELETQSLFRAVVEPDCKDAVMVIDFGKTRTSFLVGEESVVKFGSTVSVAGENIDNALAKKLNLSIFEAEELKKKKILRKTEEGGDFEVILPVVSVIKDEIAEVSNYWQTYAEEQGFKNKEIKKIILCGGDANMPGLTDYLSYGSSRPVEAANPWVNIFSFENYVPEMEHRESFMYATAIGLALRNFLREV